MSKPTPKGKAKVINQSRTDLDEKLFKSLEKLGQIWRNRLWKAVLDEDLSPVQGQILIFIAHHASRRNRVGELAREFGLTNATISEAVATLARKGLVAKVPDEQDKRIHLLKLTPSGDQVVKRLTGWGDEIKAEIKAENSGKKKEALSFLLELLARLKRRGLVDSVRMCWFCQHFHPDYYRRSRRPHYCDLLNRPIDTLDFRLDCPSFTASSKES